MIAMITKLIYNYNIKTPNIMGQYDVGINMGAKVELVEFATNIGRGDHVNTYMESSFVKHGKVELAVVTKKLRWGEVLERYSKD